MSLTRTMVRLHPPAFRERWGTALEADARSAGWRSWPSLAGSAIDMWLHPVVWPASSAAQRRHRAVALAFSATVTVCIVGRAVVTSDGTAFPHWPAWSLDDCAVVLCFGSALITPLPRATAQATAALLRRAARGLSGPVLVLVAALVAAHEANPATMPLAHAAAADSFWLGLGFTAVQLARVVCTADADLMVLPQRPRLYAGLAVLATGSVLAALIMLTRGLDIACCAAGALLLTLCLLFLVTLRDLRTCG